MRRVPPPLKANEPTTSSQPSNLRIGTTGKGKKTGKLLRRKNPRHATVAVDNPHRGCSDWLACIFRINSLIQALLLLTHNGPSTLPSANRKSRADAVRALLQWSGPNYHVAAGLTLCADYVICGLLHHQTSNIPNLLRCQPRLCGWRTSGKQCGERQQDEAE
jgi:hypothetical protein